MRGGTLGTCSAARVGMMLFSSFLMRAGAVAVALSAVAMPLRASTLILFDSLTPTVSGEGSITYRGDTADHVVVNTVSGFGLAPLPGGDPHVMFMPAFSSTQGFLFDTGISVPNGRPDAERIEYINRYTMIFDVYWQENRSWYAFYNAEGVNGARHDADFFRRFGNGIGGLGIGGVYLGDAVINQWHRVAFTVTDTSATRSTVSIYLNGVYLGDSDVEAGTDMRFSLYLSGVGSQTALFTDNDGETAPAYVSRFFFDNRVYSPAEIAALGGPGVTPVPEPSSLLFLASAGWLGGRLWRRRSRIAK